MPSADVRHLTFNSFPWTQSEDSEPALWLSLAQRIESTRRLDAGPYSEDRWRMHRSIRVRAFKELQLSTSTG